MATPRYAPARSRRFTAWFLQDQRQERVAAADSGPPAVLINAATRGKLCINATTGGILRLSPP